MVRTLAGGAALALALTAAAPAARPTVGARGYAGIVPGMTLAQAKAASGITFVVDPRTSPDPELGCVFAVPRGRRQPWLMLTNGRVGRIDVTTRGVPATGGILVGDPATKVAARLGAANVVVSPHKYDADGTYIEVKPKPGGGGFRLVFETSKGRITQFRGGRLPEVRYVEGCA